MNYPKWLQIHKQVFYNLTELELLACVLYGESATEPDDGKFAVGCVIRNRVRLRGWWGGTYRHVILAPKQFSCFNFKINNKTNSLLKYMLNAMRKRTVKYVACEAQAKLILEGKPDITGSATHYFNPSIVKPTWSAKMVRTARIANHDFYNGYT